MKAKAFFTICLAAFLIQMLSSTSLAYSASAIVTGGKWKGMLDMYPPGEVELQKALINRIFKHAEAWGFATHDVYWVEAEEDERYERLAPFYSAVDGFGEPNSFLLHISHGAKSGPLYYILQGTTPYEVYDWEIHYHSANQNLKLAVIYSCFSADTIGGFRDGNIPYGMPFAWMHTTDLSYDGYKSPDHKGRCFIGFKPYGVWMSVEVKVDGTKKENLLFNFMCGFYDGLLVYRRTVNEALDYASQKLFGVSFGNSILYSGFELDGYFCRLVVYGDGTVRLVEPLNGDFNGDAAVTAADIGIIYEAIVTGSFGYPFPPPNFPAPPPNVTLPPPCNLNYDLNSDGKLNWLDLSIELAYYIQYNTKYDMFLLIPPAIEHTTTSLNQIINATRTTK